MCPYSAPLFLKALTRTSFPEARAIHSAARAAQNLRGEPGPTGYSETKSLNRQREPTKDSGKR